MTRVHFVVIHSTSDMPEMGKKYNIFKQYNFLFVTFKYFNLVCDM